MLLWLECRPVCRAMNLAVRLSVTGLFAISLAGKPIRSSALVYSSGELSQCVRCDIVCVCCVRTLFPLLCLPAAGCPSSDFDCDNGNCVQASLECDGRDDCHDNSDEKYCSTATVIGIATGVALGFLIIFIAIPILTCLLVWCCLVGRRTHRLTSPDMYHVQSTSSMTIISSSGIQYEMAALVSKEDDEWCPQTD
jgi:hypothetical protein